MGVNPETNRLNEGLAKWVDSASADLKGSYQEAAKRIREAFENKRPLLNLHAMSLRTLPNCLHLLKDVESIDVTDNTLHALPENIDVLNNLQHVYISGNQPLRLSNNSSKIDESTTHDDIFKASLDRWAKTAPRQLKYVYQRAVNEIYNAYTNKSTTLDLKGYGLLTLPAEIGNLTQLSQLYLFNNQLTALPKEIGNLTQLSQLYLFNNQLTALPKEIGNLTQLTKLNLNNNQLTALPKEIRNLTQLTELNLSYNPLKVLPAEIWNLTQLESLDLGGNHELTALPKEIGNLTQLTKLNLNNNQLTALPKEIRNLTQLTELNLSYNPLKVLPAEIWNLTQLKALDLSSNLLTALPKEIENLTQLELLNLRFNQLTALPKEIWKLTQLSQLDLSHNQLRALPKEIENLTQLSLLYLGDNQLTALPVEIRNLTQLKALDLSSNLLTALPIEIGNLRRLTQLNLSSNLLIALPIEIGNLTLLESLIIRNNPDLRVLPVTLCQIPGITYTDIDGTAINAADRNALLNATQQLRSRLSLKQLPKLLTFWYGFAGRNNDISAILEKVNELSEENRDGLYEWLVRLAKTSDFERDQSKMSTAVCAILDDIINPEEDSDFPNTAFTLIKEHNECCGDRAAMGLNEIYVAWICRNIHKQKKDPVEQYALLVGIGRTLALRKALAELIAKHNVQKNHTQGESVEIYLYYETILRQELDLVTCIKSMIYYSAGKKDYIEEQMEEIKNRVKKEGFFEAVSFPFFNTRFNAQAELDEKKKPLEALMGVLSDPDSLTEKEISDLINEQIPDKKSRVDLMEFLKTLKNTSSLTDNDNKKAGEILQKAMKHLEAEFKVAWLKKQLAKQE